jgi:hypothetical protein
MKGLPSFSAGGSKSFRPLFRRFSSILLTKQAIFGVLVGFLLGIYCRFDVANFHIQITFDNNNGERSELPSSAEKEGKDGGENVGGWQNGLVPSLPSGHNNKAGAGIGIRLHCAVRYFYNLN